MCDSEQQRWHKLPDGTHVGAIGLKADGGVVLRPGCRVVTVNELYHCVGELVYALTEPLPYLLATLDGLEIELLETRCLRWKSTLRADRLLFLDDAEEVRVLRYCCQENGWSCFRAPLDGRATALQRLIASAAQADRA
jgi:hypothetical protein